MNPRMLMFVLIMLAAATVSGASCEIEDPSKDAVKKDSGILNTGGSDTQEFKSTVKGGQAVWVKVKDANVLGAGIVVTIASAGKDLCTSSLVLLPQKSKSFKSGVFSDRSVTYDITVGAAEGSEVIADVTVLALPAPK